MTATGSCPEAASSVPTPEQLALGGPRYRFCIGRKEVVVRPLTWRQIERAEDAVADAVQTLARHPNFDFANPMGMAGVVAGLGIRVIGKLLRQFYDLEDQDLENLDLVAAGEIILRQLEVSQLPEIEKKGGQILDLWRRLRSPSAAGPGTSISSSPSTDGPGATSGSARAQESA